MRALPLLLSAMFLAAAAVRAEPVQVGGEAAWTPPKSALAEGLKAPAFDESATVAIEFPVIDPKRIEALKFDNSAPLAKVLRVGVEREAAEARKRGPARWRAQADGSHVARFAVTSPGAVALRSALDVAQLPAGAEVRVLGSDGEIFATAAADIAKLHETRWWSPVTAGEVQTIELWLPAGADPQWAGVGVAAVSHLFVSPEGDLAGAKIGESDSCEYDAKCVTEPTQAYVNAKNSVARMLFQTGGSSALCTGTLLNDTDANTQVPNFFGAAHCFTSQSVANTLTTFWFYEATACDSGVLDSGQRQIGGGATVLYSSVAADALLVRLNNAPPAGAYYLGWNAAQIANGTEIVVLHHPAGDVKKVSIGAVKGFGGSNLASGQFIKVGYVDGTTEGGSSGCGLLVANNGEFQLRGGLLGGTAGCANTGSLSTPANSDDFSRFDLVYPSLQAFLAPAGNQGPTITDFTGIYNNPDQSGWGLAIVRGQSGTHAVNLYHYGQDGQSAWFLTVGQFNAGGSYTASVIATQGPWFGNVPYNPALVGTRVAGTLSLQFTSNTQANLSFTIDGRTVTTTVRKLAF